MFHFPADFVVVDFEPDPRVPLILGRCFLKTSRALIDVHKSELTLRIGNEAITLNLDQTSSYSANYDQMTANKIDGGFTAVDNKENEFIITRLVTGWRVCIDYQKLNEATRKDHFPLPFMDQMLERLARNEYYCFLYGFSRYFQIPIDPCDQEKTTLTCPYGTFAYRRMSFGLCNAPGKFQRYSDPSPPIPNHEQSVPLFKEELKAFKAKTIKSSIDEPPEVELKDLPPHLEYAFLEGDNKFPVIIAKALRDEEKSALIKVLKSHKRAIAWKLADIQGIDPEFCTHKILMEEDYKPAVQNQRRVNPKIHGVIKKEVEKLLDAGLIYPISDSPWVSPEKTTFTCPYGTFAYRRMPFGLCNAPVTFQRCMLAIFYDMVEKTMEVFIDDFSVFGNSFENCLSRLDKMLQ
nr:retrovirus-related Pol polyprotein from transposon 17.6 [Tanacetum cinerariifolium]